jgi:hypothetical protein
MAPKESTGVSTLETTDLLLEPSMTNLLDLFVQEAEKRPLNSKNLLEAPQVLRSLYSNFAV